MSREMSEGRVRKRMRIPVSCRICRKRKSKCDKSKPQCRYCRTNNLQCVYENGTSGEDHQAMSVAHSYSSDEMLIKTSPDINNNINNSNAQDPQHINRLEQALFLLQSQLKNLEDSVKHSNGAVVQEKNREQQQDFLPSDHPYIDPTDEIDFFARNSTPSHPDLRFQNLTPFAWKTMVKKDPYVQTVWFKLIFLKEGRIFLKTLNDSKKCHAVIASVKEVAEPAGAANTTFSKALAEDLPVDSDIPAEFQKEENLDKGLNKLTELLKKGLEYGSQGTDEQLESLESSMEKTAIKKPTWLSVTPRATTHDQLIKLILEKLPTRKVIWLLVDRFFKYAYPFMPYLDESCFLNVITKIIGKRSMEETKIKQLNINVKLEIAVVGILLFILELGSLSLNNTKTDNEVLDDDTEYLLKHPLIKDNATAAKYCYAQFKLCKHVNLEFLQLAIYACLYRRYSEQNTEAITPNESRIFHGLLLHMAVSLGLHRDSDVAGVSHPWDAAAATFMDSIVSREKIVNLKRKIWQFVVANDGYHTYIISSPSASKLDFYDTEMPIYPSVSNSNCANDDVEIFVYESMAQFAKFDRLQRELAYDALDLRPSNVKRIATRTHRLRELVKSEYKSFRHILFEKYNSGNTYLDNLRRIYAVSQYTEAMATVYMSCYHLLIYYDFKKTNDKAGLYYLHKVVEIASELSEAFPHLLTRCKEFFGTGLDYYLIPALELMFHKVVQVKICLSFRFKQFRALASMNHDTSRAILNDQIEDLERQILSTYIRGVKALVTITDRYYYAWRMSKFQRLCILMLADKSSLYERGPDQKLIFKGGFPQDIRPPEDSMLYRLSTAELQKFLSSVKVALSQKRSNEHFDPTYMETIDNIPLNYNYNATSSQYSKKSSERTKPLSTTDNQSDSSTRKNSNMNESPASLESDSSSINFAPNPSIDKWWMEFVCNENSTQYTDVFGQLPANFYDDLNSPGHSIGNDVTPSSAITPSSILSVVGPPPYNNNNNNKNNNNNNTNNTNNTNNLNYPMYNDNKPFDSTSTNDISAMFSDADMLIVNEMANIVGDSVNFDAF